MRNHTLVAVNVGFLDKIFHRIFSYILWAWSMRGSVRIVANAALWGRKICRSALVCRINFIHVLPVGGGAHSGDICARRTQLAGERLLGSLSFSQTHADAGRQRLHTKKHAARPPAINEANFDINSARRSRGYMRNAASEIRSTH